MSSPGAPAPTTTTKKRKSTAASTQSKKKVSDPHASARALVASINQSPEDFDLPDGEDEVRKTLVAIAAYVKTLEPVVKSSSEIATEAERLKRTVVTGIKKQMTWKPSCKTRTAKFAYEGICNDPAVFSALLGLDEKATWKMKKFTVSEIRTILNDNFMVEIRYGCLDFASDVTVRWNAETGEFKFTGSYGK